ncbi:MAG: DUF2735 domain-containing protein [Proteobacteria bacterium]|nr:DUF2735 domain-containing protein [Pseudomonadota bacterium]
MTANVPRETATIYQFPVGGRAGLTRHAGYEKPDALPTIAYGGSWYHDEAIREAAEQARKN